ncbi:cytochrome c3 family protein [Geobacter sulfurreducens]|uniref:Lipoprotein cytochrome c n=1 Tax=Geobacter sulfurreducens (strain ATCC 51573 / DSM 12127 / PCA) TaxID=243231 RepID=Q74FL5_GEOSL|nr:cytochrome c3 family protein [Geobacter sulfurreducens]AAR33923.1 lipoprotein cytochrome c [Geobacter sulfurreducens PCA]ADI83433.1 menaquinol oxidoreductase complex Cbc5, cytochrome c subunit, putative, 12 heme-binding sites [Geobacter sulfurreducens KN400]AJY70347.1 cytochrome C [Geobacter sulfurreducens]QVW35839.1 cytochrome c3 family protein [Geobacter sulfurreducens]UAC04663.1 cytochrome c3 family protein [Geobacter sulfurreducens]
MRFRCLPLLAVCIISLAGFAYGITIKDAVFQTKDAGRVVFSHKAHIGKKGIENNCKACHDGIFSLRKKVSYTMADMEKGKSCGACHNGKEGVFPLKECARCHAVKEITYQVKSTGPTPFSHQKHLAVYDNCNACHPKLFNAGPNKRATMADMEKGKSCGACHNGKTAFGLNECATCHMVKEVLLSSPGTGKIIFSHKLHAGKMKCDQCHNKLYVPGRNKPVGMAAMEKGKSCGACHNGKSVFDVKQCAKCHPVKEVNYKVKGAGPATFSHALHLSMYTCSDCHNKLYKTGRNTKVVTMHEMEKGKSCGACHNGKTAFSVREDCVKCHNM